jgi:hypothetical protein
VRNGLHFGSNLGVLVPVFYRSEACNLLESAPECFCICVSYIIHYIGNVFACYLEKALGSLNANPLKVFEWSIVSSLPEPSFEGSAACIGKSC